MTGRITAALAGLVSSPLRTHGSGIFAALVIAGTAAALAIPDAASQSTIRGEALVVDGDSLVIGAERIRLAGIDAPELRQQCGAIWCGLAAKAQLEELIGRDIVTCEERDRDKYRRIVAVCGTTRHPDLGALLVATGYAIAYRRYSLAYVDQEEAAKAERLGIWRTRFVNPEEWRRGKR